MNAFDTGITGRRDLELGRDQTVRLQQGARGILVRADRGTVLLTREGDREDHVLEPGESLLVSGPGLVIAWALAPAHLTVEQAPEGASPRHGHPLHAAA
jgi:hypothetical protein